MARIQCRMRAGTCLTSLPRFSIVFTQSVNVFLAGRTGQANRTIVGHSPMEHHQHITMNMDWLQPAFPLMKARLAGKAVELFLPLTFTLHIYGGLAWFPLRPPPTERSLLQGVCNSLGSPDIHLVHSDTAIAGRHCLCLSDREVASHGRMVLAPTVRPSPSATMVQCACLSTWLQ